MKKNPNELIIRAIEARQLELLTEALNNALEMVENPPKTFKASMKGLGKTMSGCLMAAKLQRIKRELTPKPKLKPGGTAPKMLKIEFMNKDEKLYIKNPLDKA